MNDIADISEIAKLVGRIVPGTEEQFLLIGSRLNKVYSDVENISRQASALVGLLDSSAMKGTIARFRDVLSQLERYIGQFHQRFESGYAALKDVGMPFRMSRFPWRISGRSLRNLKYSAYPLK